MEFKVGDIVVAFLEGLQPGKVVKIIALASVRTQWFFACEDFNVKNTALHYYKQEELMPYENPNDILKSIL